MKDKTFKMEKKLCPLQKKTCKYKVNIYFKDGNLVIIWNFQF